LMLTLESTAKTDDVTGLPNERAWEEEVPRELARARRQRGPLSVAIVDLGGLELSPDGKPSSAEARVLRDAAGAWRKALRPGDFLAHRRPGRFAVLLPDLDAGEAEAAVERMRAVAPGGRECRIAVATWNGFELPAALVARAEAGVRAGAMPPAA
jgi:diguanylate cyclase